MFHLGSEQALSLQLKPTVWTQQEVPHVSLKFPLEALFSRTYDVQRFLGVVLAHLQMKVINLRMKVIIMSKSQRRETNHRSSICRIDTIGTK